MLFIKKSQKIMESREKHYTFAPTKEKNNKDYEKNSNDRRYYLRNKSEHSGSS
jgi:hypothetical protein